MTMAGMDHALYPQVTAKMSERRKQLAPGTHDAFVAFSHAVFAEGALPEVTKQLIAVAVAHSALALDALDEQPTKH